MTTKDTEALDNHGLKEEQKKRQMQQAGMTVLLGVITGAISVVLLQYYQAQFALPVMQTYFAEVSFVLVLLQVSIVFVLYSWVTALIGNKWIGSTLVLIVSWIAGIANQQKDLFRGEPLYPNDLLMIKELPFLVKIIDKKILVSALILIVLLSVTGVLVGYWRLKKWKAKNMSTEPKKSMKSLYLTRALVFISSSLLIVYIANFNQPKNVVQAAFNRSAVWVGWSQQQNYLDNGFVAGFLFNLDSPGMEQPSNYSKESINEIVAKYKKSATETNLTRNQTLEDINIIYVMNETFTDPSKINGMSQSRDPIPKTHELLKQNRSGEVLSQGYGGGTANIEFEALTGFSMEPMLPSITTPYTQLTKQIHQMPSLVSYLKDSGHQTTAIHPYDTYMYKRTDVYREMGFKTFLYDATMNHTTTKDQNTFISDESAYQEVMDRLNHTKEKDFIHLVTMQNHAPYPGKYPETDFVAGGTDYSVEAIENYYQDLAYSDDALEMLIDQLAEYPEKTIVFFWGDHLPGFYSDEIYQQNNDLTMHQTPLLIYTNFSEDNADLGVISPIYFANHLLELTNVSLSPYYALLSELEAVLPAFEKSMYVETSDSEMKMNREELAPETLELLNDYDAVMYDVLTGENYSSALEFFNPL